MTPLNRTPRFTRRWLYHRRWGTPHPLAWLDMGSEPFAWVVVALGTAVALVVVGFNGPR